VPGGTGVPRLPAVCAFTKAIHSSGAKALTGWPMSASRDWPSIATMAGFTSAKRPSASISAMPVGAWS
jgi:hypothetical protein